MKSKKMLVNIGFKKGFSSRYALVFYLVSALISITIQFFLWKAVLVNKSEFQFRQTISYLVLMQFLTLIFPKSSYELNDEIKSGDIALSLLKPITLSAKFFWEGVGYSLAKIVVIGFVELITYFWLIPYSIDLLSILMVSISIILAYILYFEMELILGTFSFYTYSIWGITTFKSAILLILAGNIFPVEYYPEIIKRLANILPFQYSFGAVGLVSQNPDIMMFARIALVQLIYIVAFRFIYIAMFNRAVRSIVIQGG
ncbi:ABC transporter permease [Lactobacillus helveticus]|uniref:ABC transporter permease n=1 Tax=Lactobacillus helveticus TaxID=1587 RepID=UPI0009352B5A|nr:ABC-2 family transporter protein [Lactobacillus helveticus]